MNIDQPTVFVTGKGGVGKSLMAASIATKLAKTGKKTLLVELGDESYYKDALRLKALSTAPQKTSFGFDIAQWSGESCLREYVLHYIKVEGLYKLFFENKVMRSFLNVAPAVNELSIVGKLTSGLRKVGPEFHYDHVVVDGYATGHALALLRAPFGMAQAIDRGPMGKESLEMQVCLKNPRQIKYVIVTLLEDLPVSESVELNNAIKNLTGIESSLIINKSLLDGPAQSDLEFVIKNEKDEELIEFSKFLMGKRERQQSFVGQLEKNFSEVYSVPFHFESNMDVLVKNIGGSF